VELTWILVPIKQFGELENKTSSETEKPLKGTFLLNRQELTSHKKILVAFLV